MWGSKFLIHHSFSIPDLPGGGCKINPPFQCHLIKLLAGTTFQQRDCVPRSVDSRIMDQEKIALRSASFFSIGSLMDRPDTVATWLESAHDFSWQKSIKAMAAAMQQLVRSSTPITQQKPPFTG